MGVLFQLKVCRKQCWLFSLNLFVISILPFWGSLKLIVKSPGCSFHFRKMSAALFSRYKCGDSLRGKQNQNIQFVELFFYEKMKFYNKISSFGKICRIDIKWF